MQSIFNESASLDSSLENITPETLSIKHQFLKQKERMLKSAIPSKKLKIHHQDLLNLPKNIKRNVKKTQEKKKMTGH